MHRSNDGLMRPCEAKTPESCKATGPDGQHAKHYMFDSLQSANQWNALSITYATIPRSERRREAALNLLTQMARLQDGAPSLPVGKLVKTQEAASSSHGGDHNSLSKNGDATATPLETQDGLFSDEERQSMLDAAESSGTRSPKLDYVDLSTFAGKLKTDGYTDEEDADYPYHMADLPERAKDMLLDDNYNLAQTFASTKSYVEAYTDDPDTEAAEAICDAYEQLVGLDEVLPLNARRDLRRIADKWAFASSVDRLTAADRTNMAYGRMRRMLDEYSIIIDGLSPVINSRSSWLPVNEAASSARSESAN